LAAQTRPRGSPPLFLAAGLPSAGGTAGPGGSWSGMRTNSGKFELPLLEEREGGSSGQGRCPALRSRRIRAEDAPRFARSSRGAVPSGPRGAEIRGPMYSYAGGGLRSGRPALGLAAGTRIAAERGRGRPLKRRGPPRRGTSAEAEHRTSQAPSQGQRMADARGPEDDDFPPTQGAPVHQKRQGGPDGKVAGQAVEIQFDLRAVGSPGKTFPGAGLGWLRGVRKKKVAPGRRRGQGRRRSFVRGGLGVLALRKKKLFQLGPWPAAHLAGVGEGRKGWYFRDVVGRGAGRLSHRGPCCSQGWLRSSHGGGGAGRKAPGTWSR